ncbi:DUF397 domain-containing protein [Actinoplanes regularis]|uniref:DUF397 domain-containing protein n=1 Tax=Actinoplanes regularis TaxID=52697 RepID=A0A239E647_9ACTN|nr:DUF397 domain-containing protein [Actinoplanes regularis]GIE89299.1 hypothetical protein Are01nite_57790 [Actinoplanes regularis]GLW34439.1 hypothetical protein Areg01_73760 [Actinoplanes regularis]SNS39929.1 protein of unknown function [Actinoplanes regularis]
MVDLSGAVWHKSTRSGGNGGDCVEVAANLPGIVALRDTKDPDGATLIFTHAEWRAFLEGVRAGEFDLGER